MTLIQSESHPVPSKRRNRRRCTERDRLSSTAFSTTDHYYEAMVHPSLLIHPHPHRVVIVYDVTGQILAQVLQHTFVQEVIYILPEESSYYTTTPSTPSSRRMFEHNDPRVTFVHTNDPISFLQQQQQQQQQQQLLLPDTTTLESTIEMVDVVFVDYLT